MVLHGQMRASESHSLFSTLDSSSHATRLVRRVCLLQPFAVVFHHLIKAAESCGLLFWKSLVCGPLRKRGGLVLAVAAWLTGAVTLVVLLCYSCRRDPLSCRECG